MSENIRPKGVVHLRHSVLQKEISFLTECHHFRRQVHPVVKNGITSGGTRTGQRKKKKAKGGGMDMSLTIPASERPLTHALDKVPLQKAKLCV